MSEGISADYGTIELLNLRTGELTPLGLDGYDARFVTPGHLVFGRASIACAVAFDPSRREIVGDPRPIASDVRAHAVYPHLQLAVAAGVLIHVGGGDVGVSSVAWVLAHRCGRVPAD